MTHTTTDAAEARAPGHDEVPTLEQATRWLGRFSNQDKVASTTPRKIAFELAGIHSLLLSLATAEAASGAGERDTAKLRAVLEKWDADFPLSYDERQAFITDILASLPPATDPAIPDGWKLVPIEPTDEMICAGREATSPKRPTNWEDSSAAATWQVAAAIRAGIAAAPTIPATGEAEPKPLRVDWNKHDLAEAYDLVEGVRSKMAQSSESPLDTSLRAALNAIEAADCEWDGLTKATIPATGHAATEGEG